MARETAEPPKFPGRDVPPERLYQSLVPDPRFPPPIPKIPTNYLGNPKTKVSE
jgi:hypothetical protein